MSARYPSHKRMLENPFGFELSTVHFANGNQFIARGCECFIRMGNGIAATQNNSISQAQTMDLFFCNRDFYNFFKCSPCREQLFIKSIKITLQFYKFV